MLKLNYNKRELMLFTTKITRHAQNSHLTMNNDITTNIGLRYLVSVCNFLINAATATLVSVSRIDCHKSVLFCSTQDVTSQLQQINNNASQAILHFSK